MSALAMRTAVWLGCCAALTTAPARAQAGDAEERSAALFHEGVAAGKAGDYVRAESAFRSAYSLVPSGATLRNLALTEMKLGKMVDALHHLRVAVNARGLSPEQRAVVQQNLDDAYGATGHLAIRTSDGARVAVDGKFIEGTAPFEQPVDVPEGRRRLEARLGARTSDAEVDAPGGQVVEANLPLEIEPAARTQAPVSSVRALGASPEVPGSHDATPRAGAPGWWTPAHALGVGLAAAAVAGIALGIGFDAASQSAASDANRLRTSLGAGACVGQGLTGPCAALSDKINAVHDDDAGKWAGFAVGAAAAAGSLPLLFLPQHEVALRTGSVRWTPVLAPASAGLVGAF
jgi:hypothetical protein